MATILIRSTLANCLYIALIPVMLPSVETNRLSIAFHRKPGFHVTRENDKGFEFYIAIRELTTKPAVQRATARAACRPESGAPDAPDAPAILRKV
ncbi:MULTISPECIES: hypothetical protein [Paraburkholderia]|uniref:hypothetical protein n=1 Tax=Paraburkholderia TaxID=1822464 RepID=UPI0038B9C275